MVAKAAASGADVVVLDLEDAVAPDSKDLARSGASVALTTLDWGATGRAVRINGVGTSEWEADLDALADIPDLDLVCMPKVEWPEQVLEAAAAVSERWIRRPTPGLELLIESPAGLANIGDLLRASPLVDSVVFGPADFTAEAGARSLRTAPGDLSAIEALLDHARLQLLLAARAAGVIAIDGPCLQFRDRRVLEREAGRAAAWGFDGKWAIHPAQLAAIGEAFSVTPEEMRASDRVEEALRESDAAGRGATGMDGALLDAASLRQVRAAHRSNQGSAPGEPASSPHT